MSSRRNFDRQYRLACGPGGATGFEVGETSADQPIPLHISFSIQKSDTETQNSGKVSIWNLNNEHLSVLNKKDCALSLRAGYGTRLSLIFAGIISFVSTTMDGADRVTEIEAIDNRVEIRDTYVSVSYRGKVNSKTIMDDVAAQMGVAVTYSYNAKFVDLPNGFSYVGQAKNIMNKICKCCGLKWSIQNGVMQVKRPGDVMKKEVYLLNAESGLIGSPARVVVSPEEATEESVLGWDVEYLLNGAIHVDDYVKLETAAVTGYFRVYSLDIAGDNITGDWYCKARLLEVS
ncbi:MAG: hypothetical protein IKJ99_03435 [Oscillospiraceae bacterium]|nr:hypothetical protein [Oscillospiraceae bacterium]